VHGRRRRGGQPCPAARLEAAWGLGGSGSIWGVTRREKAHALLDELPESEIEPVVEFIVSRREGGIVDEWGDLSKLHQVATKETMRRLAAEERAAGHEPW
jgi:hypothetical protein